MDIYIVYGNRNDLVEAETIQAFKTQKEADVYGCQLITTYRYEGYTVVKNTLEYKPVCWRYKFRKNSTWSYMHTPPEDLREMLKAMKIDMEAECESVEPLYIHE